MKFAKTVLPMLGLLLSQNALADDGLSGANTAWILTSTALVLMMTTQGSHFFTVDWFGSKTFCPY